MKNLKKFENFFEEEKPIAKLNELDIPAIDMPEECEEEKEPVAEEMLDDMRDRHNPLPGSEESTPTLQAEKHVISFSLFSK